MKILSLFDGISCGQIALSKLMDDYTYYSSEIDDKAIKVTQNSFPETIQLGDILDWREWELPKIDLLIGGSPCQGFSSGGKGLGLRDDRSKLFFEFVDVLKHHKPKRFLLENVSMVKRDREIISSILGVEPVEINSSLVSAQNRKRLYWANFPIRQPEDREISFSEYIQGFSGRIVGRRLKNGIRNDYDYSIPIKQYIESRKDNKSNCLTTVTKDNIVTPTKHDRTYFKDAEFRFLTPNEYEWLQTLPYGYTEGLSDSVRTALIGNAWTVEVIIEILEGMV